MQNVFEYYEIENTTSEYASAVSGQYTTLESARQDLPNHGDWWRPNGTGTIYKVWFTVDGTKVTTHRELVEKHQ